MKIIANNQIFEFEQNRNNENFYFTDFLLALLKVPNEYVIWPYGIDKQMSERVFAYELYHQWRLIANQFNYENLLINGEIRKDGSVLRNNFNDIVYPDLILHEQQNNLNQQKIACEIKTVKSINSSNGKFNVKKDLKKLGKYITELQFETGIFIQIGNHFNEFSETIRYLKKNEAEFTNSDKIYYVIKDHASIKFETLENLLNANA
ncbi:hypothetical protein Q73A0000_06960 [Kaistella flava (ex Peng et al. 2021)]|uniref:Uncharacterized protein n=1 Tax=Kaistella flava (ex Peng et al. 2021) TaxID=2038776 RepID=A0A7M2Y7N1_9FLAO|nr:hypothetical protein [Kaistella flava (ex Peng et al. 2021)]QOW10116.1 hypothetical protein Q73A0000_06960 [Kaistella flava (ex Peng et al. 2021)]